MGVAKFTGRACARAAAQRKRRRTCGCWVRQLILRQKVILFWLSTRDQTKIWTLPAPSSFTFSHSSRGTYTHLFHPFVYLAPTPLCCTCEELDGKTGNRDEKKISRWSERTEMTGRSEPKSQFGFVWSLIRKYSTWTNLLFVVKCTLNMYSHLYKTVLINLLTVLDGGNSCIFDSPPLECWNCYFWLQLQARATFAIVHKPGEREMMSDLFKSGSTPSLPDRVIYFPLNKNQIC